MDLMKIAEEAFAGEKKEFPAFAAGDQVTVAYPITWQQAPLPTV